MDRVTVFFRRCVLSQRNRGQGRQAGVARVFFDLCLAEHQFNDLYADVRLASAADRDLGNAPVVTKDNYGGFFASPEFMTAVRRYCKSSLARELSCERPKRRVTRTRTGTQFDNVWGAWPPSAA